MNCQWTHSQQQQQLLNMKNHWTSSTYKPNAEPIYFMHVHNIYTILVYLPIYTDIAIYMNILLFLDFMCK